VVKPELGTKRACTSCGAKFYDLNKMPVECPKCEASYVPDILLPSKETMPPKEVVAKPVVETPAETVDKEDTADVEVISLDEVDEEEDVDADDDEIAAIADVDLGDDDTDDDAEEDNTFLETDGEDDDDVTGLIGGVASDDEAT